VGVRYTAVVALRGIDSPQAATPALLAALKDKDAEIRGLACEVLAEVAEDRAAAARALVVLLRDKDANVRDAALSNLVVLGPSAVLALTAAVRDRDAAVRIAACSALGDIGHLRGGAGIGSVLESAAKDEDAAVRAAAAAALKRFLSGGAS
jgi:HEAT repeat protein